MGKEKEVNVRALRGKQEQQKKKHEKQEENTGHVVSWTRYRLTYLSLRLDADHLIR